MPRRGGPRRCNKDEYRSLHQQNNDFGYRHSQEPNIEEVFLPSTLGKYWFGPFLTWMKNLLHKSADASAYLSIFWEKVTVIISLLFSFSATLLHKDIEGGRYSGPRKCLSALRTLSFENSNSLHKLLQKWIIFSLPQRNGKCLSSVVFLLLQR